MLQAIISNKAGRNLDSNDIHWRELFKTSEDSLTSTIIGTLLYLPNDLFWQILCNACYGVGLPAASSIKTVQFWPRWDAAEDSGRSVEPDVFIETPEFDLIIEAKRFDENQQTEWQITREIGAYRVAYAEASKKLYLLQLGGILNQHEECMNDCAIVKCTWQRLAFEVRQMKEHCESTRSAEQGLLRILSDVLEGFAVHGYFTGDWFESFVNYRQYSISEDAVFDFGSLGLDSFYIFWPASYPMYKIDESCFHSFLNLNYGSS